jgi:hypothetical protein
MAGLLAGQLGAVGSEQGEGLECCCKGRAMGVRKFQVLAEAGHVLKAGRLPMSLPQCLLHE